jgi:hypothetical protein
MKIATYVNTVQRQSNRRIRHTTLIEEAQHIAATLRLSAKAVPYATTLM